MKRDLKQRKNGQRDVAHARGPPTDASCRPLDGGRCQKGCRVDNEHVNPKVSVMSARQWRGAYPPSQILHCYVGEFASAQAPIPHLQHFVSASFVLFTSPGFVPISVHVHKRQLHWCHCLQTWISFYLHLVDFQYPYLDTVPSPRTPFLSFLSLLSFLYVWRGRLTRTPCCSRSLDDVSA